MAKMNVYLTDGFKDDRVEVSVDGHLSRGSHVPTALENGQFTHSVVKQIGFA